jgi:hypothetical protein
MLSNLDSKSASIWMKFSGPIHFWTLKANPLSVFDKKFGVARENSGIFDFLTKTAHFQQFFKKFMSTVSIMFDQICSLDTTSVICSRIYSNQLEMSKILQQS